MAKANFDIPDGTKLAGLREKEGDALHIATAACHGMGCLLTWNSTHIANAEVPASNRVLQPLPGCVSLFLFYPGVRFAHPRLSSFGPAGAEFGTTDAVPLPF